MINLILITSIIKPPNTRLSYSERSVYNYQERFEQTKYTIQSIREKIPNNKIFIIECSPLTNEEESYFLNNSEYFINIYENTFLRERIYSESKSLGEGTMTSMALNYIINDKIEFDNFFKISGRYYISEKFDYNNFNNSDVVVNFCRKYEYQIINKYVNTSLYKLPHSSINLFYDFLNNEKTNELMYKSLDYEHLFGIFIESLKTYYTNDYNVIHLNNYGCKGLVSTENNSLHDI
jgi:hypothetical protein